VSNVANDQGAVQVKVLLVFVCGANTVAVVTVLSTARSVKSHSSANSVDLKPRILVRWTWSMVVVYVLAVVVYTSSASKNKSINSTN
jgi:hypothetical protein